MAIKITDSVVYLGNNFSRHKMAKFCFTIVQHNDPGYWQKFCRKIILDNTEAGASISDYYLIPVINNELLKYNASYCSNSKKRWLKFRDETDLLMFKLQWI